MTRLKLWRMRRKMSIQDLADKSGVNRATISRIERGVNKPYGQTLGKLSEALKIDPSELEETEKEELPDYKETIAKIQQEIVEQQKAGSTDYDNVLRHPDGTIKVIAIHMK